MLGSAEHDLVATAAATGRPRVCLPKQTAAGGRGASVWSLARTPQLQRYCHLIARAHARLRGDPLAARSAALAADEVLPGRAPTRVVMARTALSMDRIAEAWQEFNKALSIDPQALEQPLAMHDLAVAQWRSGKLREALATYRILVPRAGLLPDRELRARVMLEAAHVAMALAAEPPPVAPSAAAGAPPQPAVTPPASTPPANTPPDKEPALDETLAFLRAATADPHHRLRLDVELSLVLALDRVGRSRQADAVLGELSGTARWAETARPDYLAAVADLPALRALAWQQTDRARAIQQWQSFLAGPGGKGPWAKAATARLAGLRSPQQPSGRRQPR